MYVAAKFNDETRAKLVLRWDELETGKAGPIMKSTQSEKPLTVREKLTWVKEVKSLLNLSDSSTLSMLQQVAKPLNLPLPSYTPSKGILKSAGELLKENECSDEYLEKIGRGRNYNT